MVHRPFAGHSGPLSLALPHDRVAACDPMRRYKCGSRMHIQAMWRHAQGEGFDAALIVDHDGLVLEASTANVFFLCAGTWVTPPLALSLLPGLVRAWVLDHGLAVEGEVTVEALSRVEACVVTNAVQGARAVRRISTRELDMTSSLDWIAKHPEKLWQKV